MSVWIEINMLGMFLQTKVMDCEKCCKLFSEDGTLQAEDSMTLTNPSSSRETNLLQDQVRDLERELAQTKLQMVESKCRIQASLYIFITYKKKSWLATVVLGIAPHNIRIYWINFRYWTILQELEHQNGALMTDLQAAKNGWLKKTLSSLKITSSGLQNSAPRDEILAPISSSRTGWMSTRRVSWALKESKRAQVWASPRTVPQEARGKPQHPWHGAVVNCCWSKDISIKGIAKEILLLGDQSWTLSFLKSQRQLPNYSFSRHTPWGVFQVGLHGLVTDRDKGS